jgi:hypothetical protein
MSTRALDTAAAVTVPSALISWFIDTLPIVQWTAGAVAIVVGILAVYRHFKK